VDPHPRRRALLPVDTLAWVLSLVVTGVGALVLFYFARYFRADEPGLGRFAGCLVAFAGAMYGLVTADDIIVMFMFWEITSVLSYLLIGHHTDRRESRGAALQALLVTTFRRAGDDGRRGHDLGRWRPPPR
jgi:multicomponent Na+:H+ antiporter subunit A